MSFTVVAAEPAGRSRLGRPRWRVLWSQGRTTGYTVAVAEGGCVRVLDHTPSGGHAHTVDQRAAIALAVQRSAVRRAASPSSSPRGIDVGAVTPRPRPPLTRMVDDLCRGRIL